MEWDLSQVDTPAILIDLDVMERNLERMQHKATAHGVKLRPHIKTHKIPELAHMQVRIGACGITASKVSEAEVMVEAGIGDIFIANQIVAGRKVGRLVELSKRAKLSVGLDSQEGARILSKVFSGQGEEIDCLIEINSGLNRCGVRPGEAAVQLWKGISRLPGIRCKGVFTHAGHVYGKGSLEEVKEVSRSESRMMVETARALRDIGIQPEVVSVGSTPTMKVWEGCGGIDEIRPGNYIFNDAMQVALGVSKQGECALTVLSTVISRPERDRAVIDAGSKVLALDKGAHGQEVVKGFGMILDKDAILERLSEEHGILAVNPGEELEIGDWVRIIPNHACTVVNLSDRAYGVRGGEVVEEFRIAGRGKAQ